MQNQSGNQDDLRSELRSDAQNLTDAAADRLHGEVEAHKSPLVDQARSVSSALDRAASEISGGNGPSWLKSALQQGAEQIQRLAESVEQTDSRDLVSNVRRLARDNPTTFLTACAAAGFAASRIFRADTDEVPPAQTLSAAPGHPAPAAYGQGATPGGQATGLGDIP